MLERLFLLLFVLICLGPGVSFAHPGHDHRHHHDFSDIERWVKAFEDPARATWQKPIELVKFLNLKPGQVVADLGAASGYLSRPLARAVAPSGWVFAVEVESGFFAPLHQLAADQGIQNIATVLAQPDNPCLPENSVDLILICNTLHHIEERPAYYAKLKRALRRKGRLVIVDFFHDREIPIGPKKEERLSLVQVERELSEAGFKTSSETELLPYQYIVIGQ